MGRGGLQSGGGREGSRRTLCLLSAIKNQEDEEGGRSKDIYDDDELHSSADLVLYFVFRAVEDVDLFRNAGTRRG